MTGMNLSAKGTKELSRAIKPISPASKGYAELSRASAKTAAQQKRTRRSIGLRSAPRPKTIPAGEPIIEPTFIEGPEKKKKRKTGRSATILAGRMNRRRGILLSTQDELGLLR